ncbi:hypothetical protein ACVWW1_001305 [Bradyrhizobium sp. JR3.5]
MLKRPLTSIDGKSGSNYYWKSSLTVLRDAP